MNLLRNSIVISFATLISRILGYFRDVIMASYLGAGPLNDAFIAAFKFANLFRNIFGEGALNSAFVPVFAYQVDKSGIASALKLAEKIQFVLILFLILFVSACIIEMDLIMAWTTPGFKNQSEYFFLAVELGRIMMPYLFFISLAAFYGGILNSIDKFMPFAATGVIFNMSLILFALYYDDGSTKSHSVAYGVLAAGLIELIWMIFFLKKYNVLVPIKFSKVTADAKMVFKKMVPGIIGSGITQINTWVDMIIASLVYGGMSYIYYADRIMQLPLALISTATSTAMLPALSKRMPQTASNDLKENAIIISAFFLIPSALFLSVFSNEIIFMLLKRGLFSATATAKTSDALSIVAIGIPAFAIIKIFNNIFYASGDTITPVKVAFCSLLLNILLSVSLLKDFEHVAISIASAGAGWFGAISIVLIALYKSYYSISRQTLVYIAIYLIVAACSISLMYYCNKVNQLNFIVSCLIGGFFYISILYSIKKINILLR